MKGFEDLYISGDIKELLANFRKAMKLDKNLDVKIDGAPAIVIWNSFKGLRGPGIGFKSLVSQLEKGEPKDYFTDIKSIEVFMEEKSIKNGKDLTYRCEAFKHALIDIAQNLKPGIMLWGDCLWTEDFIKERNSSSIKVQPNTIEYTFYKKDFPRITKDFGIYIHTLIDENLDSHTIEDANVYGAFNTSCVLSKKDVHTSIDLNKADLAKRAVENFEDFISDSLVLDLPFDDLRVLYKRALRNNLKEVKEINDYILDNSDYSEQEVKDFIIGLDYARKANDAITDMYQTNIISDIGEEGFVLNGEFKFVKDSFTIANIKHMRGLTEAVESSKTIAYSTSKDENLFQYYFDHSLVFGNNGGSNFGFASYLTTEVPDFNSGWGKTARTKLYGQNIFKFEIDNAKLFFFNYEQYLIVNPKAKPDTYIHEQLKRFGIGFTEKQIESLYPVDRFSSKNATLFFRYLSRAYYQGSKGNLRTPIDGFVYTGKQDGNTLVVWNMYSLKPLASSTDFGKTWIECNKESPEYKKYLSSTINYNSTKNTELRKSKIFDGHFSNEKEEIYRLLMAYNSNDNETSFNIAEGIFYNVVLRDNKTIDCNFKYNLSQNDDYIQFFRLRQNDFIDSIISKGWSFNSIECDGLKIGGDSDKDWHFRSVPDEYYPRDLTIYNHLKIVNHNHKEIVECLSELAPKMINLKMLILRLCGEPNSEIIEIAKSLDLELVVEKPAK